MLGHKARDFRLLTAVSLEDLVLVDNFYRQVERSIDLSFVRDLANEFYSNIGPHISHPKNGFLGIILTPFSGYRRRFGTR